MNGNMRRLAVAALAVVVTGCGGGEAPVADLEDCRDAARAKRDRIIEDMCGPERWNNLACYDALEPGHRVLISRLDQAECLEALENLRRLEGG